MEENNLGLIFMIAGMLILGLTLYFWETRVAPKITPFGEGKHNYLFVSNSLKVEDIKTEST